MPKIVKGQCSSRGNETRICSEQCSEDGLTCLMKVKLDRCTCSGIEVKVEEVQKYDIKLNKPVFLASPNSDKFGKGYVRECGSCVEYCQQWPGEVKEYLVETKVLSCPKY